jgi:hypothetical protein
MLISMEASPVRDTAQVITIHAQAPTWFLGAVGGARLRLDSTSLSDRAWQR